MADVRDPQNPFHAASWRKGDVNALVIDGGMAAIDPHDFLVIQLCAGTD